jgi:excisionase family DNA binding protein
VSPEALAIEEIVRRAVREEVTRLIPRLQPPDHEYLTIREACRRYNRSYRHVRELIRIGKIDAVRRKGGRTGSGRYQFLIPIAMAEVHPELGGSV